MELLWTLKERQAQKRLQFVRRGKKRIFCFLLCFIFKLAVASDKKGDIKMNEKLFTYYYLYHYYYYYYYSYYYTTTTTGMDYDLN